MPAASSSPVDPVFCHLFAAADGLDGDRATVLSVLAAVADPRARRGVRHRLAVILALAVCAVLAGARSFTAIAEWAADTDEATRAGLGIGGAVPCESTIRRTLQRLDADALDDLAGAWAQQRTAPSAGRRRVIAVGGETLRGSATGTRPGRHLLAALDHDRGVVLGQVDVEVKTNEIPMPPVLLGKISLRGAIVTADAMHAQCEHARYLVDQRGAHYILTVKDNQPKLHAQLAAVPWARRPGHSRHPRARSRPARAAHPQGHRRGRRAALPARRPGHPDRAPSQAPRQQEMVNRDGLCRHLADRRAGPARSAGRRATRPLGNRGSSALGPRRHLRRRPFPGSDRSGFWCWSCGALKGGSSCAVNFTSHTTDKPLIIK